MQKMFAAGASPLPRPRAPQRFFHKKSIQQMWFILTTIDMPIIRIMGYRISSNMRPPSISPPPSNKQPM